MKLLTESGSAGTLRVTDGLSGVGPPPGVDQEPHRNPRRMCEPNDVLWTPSHENAM